MVKGLILSNYKIIIMSVARVALAETLTISTVVTDCDTMTFVDSTGTYPTAEQGYGLPTGTTSAHVTGAVIVVNLPDGSYLTYTFTILNNALVTATLSLSGATAVNIYSYVSAVLFPFTGFSLFGSYGVTLPALEDGVYEVDYTITGRINPDVADTAYSYTTSKSILVGCSTCCCITKLGADLDIECGCDSNEVWTFILARTFYRIAGFATNVGNTANAQLALDKASDLCENGCGCS